MEGELSGNNEVSNMHMNFANADQTISSFW